MLSDLRYAIRLAWKNKLFSLGVIATLALAIGANTAIFSVVDVALFRALPYPEPDKLAEVIADIRRQSVQGIRDAHDGATWEAMRSSVTALDLGIASELVQGVNLVVNNQAAYVKQQRVGSGFFGVLGVRPLAGREFTAEEDRAGGPPAAVLSAAVHQRYFQDDPNVIGKRILLRGEPYTVVGVMPPGFRTSVAADVWTPLKPSRSGEGSGTNYRIIARVKPDRTWEEGRTQLGALGDELIRSQGMPKDAQARFDLVPLQQGQAREIRTPLLILWGAVGAVLLIGCVNIGGMLLARGSGRISEMATRLALGAARGTIVKQMLAESLVLAIAGGAAGVALGSLLLRGLQTLGESSFDLLTSARLDWRVMGTAMLLALMTAVVCGVIPAWQASRVDIRSAQGTARSIAGRRRSVPLGLLVAGQVALAVPLLIGSGLLVRTFIGLWNLNPGFDPANVVTAKFSLQDARYNEASAVEDYVRRTTSRLQEIPGVEAAAITLSLPYERGLNMPVRIPGSGREGAPDITNLTYVSPQFFAAMRIPLLAGRVLTDGDQATSARVAVVNEAFVKTYLSGGDPIGRSVLSGKSPVQVVGVVGNVQQRPGWGSYGPLAAMPAMYVPLSQMESATLRLVHTWFSPHWVIRASGPRSSLIAAVNAAVQATDPMLPMAAFETVDDLKLASLEFQRFVTMLLSSLAVLALVLAIVGVYSLIANSVAERSRELGIRMALGSSVGEAVRTAIRPGLLWTGVGVVFGVAMGVWASRLLGSFVWGVGRMDPVTYGGVAVLLLVVAGVAAAGPGWRVSRLNPAETLRNE